MIIVLGLVILVAAVIAGVAGVLANGGSAHALGGHFAVFGYHVTGSTGTLFLYGIVIGAIGLCGLSLLLAGARRTARRGHTARRELKQSRRETASASHDRDQLLEQHEALTANTDPAEDPPASSASAAPHSDDRLASARNWRHPFGRRATAPEPIPSAVGQPRVTSNENT